MKKVKANETTKDVFKTLGSGVAGGAVGAGVYSTIGGIGIAVGGTAVGVTLGPFIAIGTGIGIATYGVFWLGRQIGQGRERRNQHKDI